MQTKNRKRYGRAAIAHELTRSAVIDAGRRKDVAVWLGVTDSRLSHWIKDDLKNPVTRMILFVLTAPLQMVQPMLDALNEAIEMRCLMDLTVKQLVAEAVNLFPRESRLDGDEDHVTQEYFRGKVPGPEFSRAHRQVSRVNARLAAIRDVLSSVYSVELREVMP